MGNKLTDNETKKALECCITRDGCKNCPRSYNGEMCRGDTPTEMIRDALDLINRLEASYKSVKKEKNKLLDTQMLLAKQVDELQDENYILKADIEKHRAYVELLDIEHESIKNCAVKEFAERVDKEITDAIFANDKVIQARVTRYRLNRYEDDLCIMCDGKIRALDGIKCFIDNLAKETVGE